MKNKYTFILAILIGIIFGAFLGDLVGRFSFFKWLNYGQSIGIDDPFTLNLYVLKFTFGFKISITVSSIIGVISSILVYRKL